jgi:enoyl-CoA hydratase/carnithine racemase
MARLDLKLDGRVAVVTMVEDDNKLNLDMCNSLLEMLDKIERETEAVTLVVTSGHEKIWSNGFDIDWVEARLAAGEKEPVMQFLQRDLELRRRLLAYPLITIAALNGHVFGGGAVLSLCFDFRYMRSDRGFFCIPVVDRGYPIFQGTSALLGSVLPMYMVEDVILTSRRFTGVECAANHVVAEAYDNAELMSKTMTFVGGLNKSRQIVGEMKKVLNGPVLKLMEKDIDHITQGEIRV